MHYIMEVILIWPMSIFGGAYGDARMPNWPHWHRTPLPGISTTGLRRDKGGNASGQATFLPPFLQCSFNCSYVLQICDPAQKNLCITDINSVLRFCAFSPNKGLLFHTASSKIPKSIKKGLKTASEVKQPFVNIVPFFGILATSEAPETSERTDGWKPTWVGRCLKLIVIISNVPLFSPKFPSTP